MAFCDGCPNRCCITVAVKHSWIGSRTFSASEHTSSANKNFCYYKWNTLKTTTNYFNYNFKLHTHNHPTEIQNVYKTGCLNSAFPPKWWHFHALMRSYSKAFPTPVICLAWCYSMHLFLPAHRDPPHIKQLSVISSLGRKMQDGSLNQQRFHCICRQH